MVNVGRKRGPWKTLVSNCEVWIQYLVQIHLDFVSITVENKSGLKPSSFSSKDGELQFLLFVFFVLFCFGRFFFIWKAELQEEKETESTKGKNLHLLTHCLNDHNGLSEFRDQWLKPFSAAFPDPTQGTNCMGSGTAGHKAVPPYGMLMMQVHAYPATHSAGLRIKVFILCK